MGLSFAVSVPDGECGPIRIQFSGAHYKPCWLDPDGQKTSETPPLDSAIAREAFRWNRAAPEPFQRDIQLEVGEKPAGSLAAHGFPGLSLYIKSSIQTAQTVTVIVLNDKAASKDRDETERNTWFQTQLTILPLGKTRFVPRDSSGGERTKDDQTAAVIYRNARSYAVGHTSSATWTEENGKATALATAWIPSAIVPAVSPNGDAVFATLSGKSLKPLSAAWLGSASDADLIAGLKLIPSAPGRCGRRTRKREFPASPRRSKFMPGNMRSSGSQVSIGLIEGSHSLRLVAQHGMHFDIRIGRWCCSAYGRGRKRT